MFIQVLSIYGNYNMGMTTVTMPLIRILELTLLKKTFTKLQLKEIAGIQREEVDNPSGHAQARHAL